MQEFPNFFSAKLKYSNNFNNSHVYSSLMSVNGHNGMQENKYNISVQVLLFLFYISMI